MSWWATNIKYCRRMKSIQQVILHKNLSPFKNIFWCFVFINKWTKRIIYTVHNLNQIHGTFPSIMFYILFSVFLFLLNSNFIKQFSVSLLNVFWMSYFVPLTFFFFSLGLASIFSCFCLGTISSKGLCKTWRRKEIHHLTNTVFSLLIFRLLYI